MKRILSLLLIFCLLLPLTACDSDEVASPGSSGIPAGIVTFQEDASGYIIPTAWARDSINDGTWGYVTAQSSIPDGNWNVENGYLTCWEADFSSRTESLIKMSLTGEELCRVTIPRKEEAGVSSSVGQFCFGDTHLWLIHNTYTVIDEETGDMESDSTLQQWSLEGELLQSFPLTDFVSEDDFITDMALKTDGDPILSCMESLVFVDNNGHAMTRVETSGTSFDFCRDKAGRLYLVDIFENTVYTINEEHMSIGDPVLTMDRMGTLFPGGGSYDFLISEELTLRGVSLSTGTITEILSWEDWDLAGRISSVAWLDEETFLVGTMGLLTDNSPVLTLSRVPANEIPEKTVIRLAVPMSSAQANVDLNWTEIVDLHITEQIASFNRASATHRIEVETFSSGTELNLLLSSGDSPDIIYWNYTSWLEDNPSVALLANKGYLEDLEPYFEADPELSLEDFIPNILDLARERSGGLHAMPTSFYFTGMTGLKEYVGSGPTWTVSDMLAVAQNMPEGMILYGYTPQKEMLDTLLEANIQDFADMQTGECDFENQTFYDLLTLVRDYFPAEITEDTLLPNGNDILSGFGSLGSLGQMATDILRPLEEQGRTIIGYPGVGGNGLSAIFMDEFSICTQSKNKDTAWEFLRSLYSYDFQTSYAGIFTAIREDVFLESERSYLVYNGSCTEAELSAAMDLIYGIRHLRTLDNPIYPIIQEEAAAFFAGDKTAEEVASIVESRVKIYISEQS